MPLLLAIVPTSCATHAFFSFVCFFFFFSSFWGLLLFLTDDRISVWTVILWWPTRGVKIFLKKKTFSRYFQVFSPCYDLLKLEARDTSLPLLCGHPSLLLVGSRANKFGKNEDYFFEFKCQSRFDPCFLFLSDAIYVVCWIHYNIFWDRN